MRHLKVLAALLVALTALPAVAGPYSESLTTCLADNTNGKDRKVLMRWILSAISAHPEMKDLSRATPESMDAVSADMGKLVTRLLSENCARQTRRAFENEGQAGMILAFEAFGKIAMEELMRSKDVQTTISRFEKYTDPKKIQEAVANAQ